jgi:Ion channel
LNLRITWSELDALMPWYLGLVGAAVGLFALHDIACTTLSVATSGLASMLVVRCYHRAALRLNHKPAMQWFVHSVGELTLLTSIGVWFLCIWTAWMLIFAADIGGIVNASTGAAASAVDLMYYSGYTITTLGLGDYRAATHVYKVLTVVASATGFFLLTAGATFVLSVSSAVTQHRLFAGSVRALAPLPLSTVAGCKSISSTDSLLQATATQLILCAQTLLCFPQSTNYCFKNSNDCSLSLTAAVLCETVLLADSVSAEACVLSEATVGYVYGAVDQYLHCAESVQGKSVGRKQQEQQQEQQHAEPLIPDVSSLREQGLPLLVQHDVEQEYARPDVAQRRQRLSAILEKNGYCWADVHAYTSSS